MSLDLNENEINRRSKKIADATGMEFSAARCLAKESIDRKTVEFLRVRRLTGLSPEEAAHACEDLARAGLLEPLKNANAIRGVAGEAATKYNITFPIPDVPRISELDFSITCGNKTLLTRFPWLFLEHEAKLWALHKWLRASYGREIPSVSEGERAYEIWGDEKELLSSSKHKSGFMELLGRLKFDMGLLRVYSTTQARYRSYVLPEPGLVLVSENLDFYYSVKRMLRRGGFDLFGSRIVGTVFGAGKAALSEAFDTFLHEEGIARASLRYIGDIDPTGIWMAQKFESAFGDVLLYPLYGEMARRHMQRRTSGAMLFHYPEEQAEYINPDNFTTHLSEEEAGEVSRCLEERVRIPQEIITLAVLEELVRND